jgi:hypothetical protein
MDKLKIIPQSLEEWLKQLPDGSDLKVLKGSDTCGDPKIDQIIMTNQVVALQSLATNEVYIL